MCAYKNTGPAGISSPNPYVKAHSSIAHIHSSKIHIYIIEYSMYIIPGYISICISYSPTLRGSCCVYIRSRVRTPGYDTGVPGTPVDAMARWMVLCRVVHVAVFDVETQVSAPNTRKDGCFRPRYCLQRVLRREDE